MRITGGPLSLQRGQPLGDGGALLHAINFRDATPADRDLRLIDYFQVRKLMGEVIHRFFGDPGLEVAAPRHAGPEHQAAIAVLRQRLSEPGFASKLSPLEHAEIELLAAAPQDFISCIARRAREQKKT